MYNGVAIEKWGTPTVVLANVGFVNDAHSAASSRQLPGLRIVAETVLCESNVASDIEAGISSAMDAIIDALTKPLTVDEKTPKKEEEQLSRIVFKGNYEEVNRFFYKRGWTDGLPIVPPTEEKVVEMMTGTDLLSNHMVTKMIPRMGKATIERIAINAVMAGCLPTYMPVLIAATQSLMDKKARFDTFEVSTGSWSPFWAINGPIRNDINLNCSSGSLSPGNIANAALGRAVGLIVKNIGGARKSIEDMGVIGNPGKYALVIGENEEETPWEPWHVQHGFKEGESTVTTFFPNSFVQTIPRDTDAQGLANMLASMGATSMSCFILIPTQAKILAREGWTKRKLLEYIAEWSTPPFINTRLSSNTSVRSQFTADDIMLIVAGGPGAFAALLRSAGGIGLDNTFVTTKIELPKDWDNLVKKYKNLVPTYARY